MFIRVLLHFLTISGGNVKQKDDVYTVELFDKPRPGRRRKPDAKSAAQRAKEYRARVKQRKFNFLESAKNA